MATWDQLKQALTAHGINFVPFGDSGAIVANFDTDEAGTRSQPVVLTPFSLEGLEFVQVESPIAPNTDEKKNLEVLRAVSISPFGIADNGEVLVLRTAMPLQDLDFSEVDFFMTAVYSIADLLEDQVFHTDSF